MSLLCNTGCRTRRPIVESAATCACAPTLVEGVAEPIISEPGNIRAMLQTVIDSCCQTDEVTREIDLPCAGIFDPEDLEIGAMVNVELDGDITFREVTRDKDECNCVSSVRFQIPISLSGPKKCGCSRTCIDRVITVVRSVELCCTKDSMLLAANSKVVAINAWISEICCDHVRVCVSFLFRSCLQQTVMREYEFTATAVCVHPNCNDTRNQLVDNCDMTCGCVAGAKKCASC